MKYFSWENSVFKAEKSNGAYRYVTFVIFYLLDTNISYHSLRKLNNKKNEYSLQGLIKRERAVSSYYFKEQALGYIDKF